MLNGHVFDKIFTEFLGILGVFVNFAGFCGFTRISRLRDRAKYQKPCKEFLSTLESATSWLDVRDYCVRG